MALTEVTLCNLALSAVGEETIQSLTETSAAAQQCSLWLEPVRDMVFRAAPWSSLERNARLALLVERDNDDDWVSTDPTPGFLYAHGVPSDMIQPRFISDYSLFKIGSVGATRSIASNSPTPILNYTARVGNVSAWDIGLQTCVWRTLAAHICIPLTGQRSKMADMFNLADQMIRDVLAQEANARQDAPQETLASWHAVRGFGGGAPGARYIFPPGQFVLMSGASVG